MEREEENKSSTPQNLESTNTENYKADNNKENAADTLSAGNGKSDSQKSSTLEKDGSKSAENTECITSDKNTENDADNENDEKRGNNECSENSENENSNPVATLPKTENDVGTEESRKSEAKEKTPLSRKVIKRIIYAVCIFAVSIMIAVFALFCVSDIFGINRPDCTADVKIPEHAKTGQIASLLQKNGIIKSAALFSVYTYFTKVHNLQYGTYTLSSQMSYGYIVAKLKNPANSRGTVKVTIPEGYTLQKIGDLLQKDDVCTKQDFLNSAENSKINFDFSSQITNDNKRLYRLEGYLFPDTYEFFLNQSSDAVVKKMLNDFDTRYNTELRSETKNSGMTVDEAVTLASIIQKESGDTSQMSKVSSVFHNRLTNGVNGKKLLQSDATVLYVLRVIKPVLSSSDTELSSDYNTYKKEGLPPGAICNPGIAAIKAALSPENTSYYYFVSDKNGKYYYAETYTEHLANVKTAVSTGKAIGTNVVN